MPTPPPCFLCGSCQFQGACWKWGDRQHLEGVTPSPLANPWEREGGSVEVHNFSGLRLKLGAFPMGLTNSFPLGRNLGTNFLAWAQADDTAAEAASPPPIQVVSSRMRTPPRSLDTLAGNGPGVTGL